jgi:hypothetical protein
MAVLEVEQYRQLNGEDILKVILKPTQRFPDGYFYCDASDEKLVRNYTWRLQSQKEPYVVAYYRDMGQLRFHREKAHNILDDYPDYINHINGIEFDNINMNLDKVSQQQNIWCAPSRGYVIAGRSFEPRIKVNHQQIRAKCTRTEVEAIQSAYQLEMQYEDYRYDFLKDRRKDIDILDLERTGKISEDEAIYRHVLRYASDNAWYLYRYNLFDYFADNGIPIPSYALDSEGFMIHSITGQRLCPI